MPGLDDEEDDGANPSNSMTPEGKAPPKESDAERKVRLKREEWANKAEGMEGNSKGMYLFYQFFMFISGLSLFLAIICVCALIYTVLQIAKAPAGEEGAQLISEGGQRERRFAHAGDLR